MIIRYTFFLLCFINLAFGQVSVRPVPWLTEGAISFLEEFLDENPNAKILEFGSGASTIWFSKRNVELTSVEHDQNWYEVVSSLLANKVDYYCLERPYYGISEEFPDEYFDLIIVDGRNRKGCIVHSLPKLKKGGVMMLDNSERSFYHAVFEHMDGWPRFDAPQNKLDSCGFWYKGWLTTWWQKPM